MATFYRFLFFCGILFAISACIGIGITLWHFDRELPGYQQLAHYQPAIMTRVHAGDGRPVAEFAAERRIFVPIETIPNRVIQAFVSAEDKNFYHHHGIDPVSLLRAAITDVSRLRDNRRPAGGSTITQQVAKNMLLSNEISIERKIKEMLLASRIEVAVSKDRILELYLNEIYLGSGAYGVAAAALAYFSKSLDELTLGETAFLAGLPKAPNRYNPARFPEAAKARRDWVLERMVEDGAASREETMQAKAQPLEPHHRQEAERVKAPYFAEEARRELLARYGENVLYDAGLSVHTSLDPRLQAAADKALRSGLIAYEHGHGGWRGAVARIAMRTGITDQSIVGRPRCGSGLDPHTGRVLAISGGFQLRNQPVRPRDSGKAATRLVDPKGDWAAHLAKVPVPAVAADVGWRLVMVIHSDPDGAIIGFANGAIGRIPIAAMRWARPRRDDGSFGPYPRRAVDVVKPGDVVMVETITASSPKAEATAANNATATFTLCQVPEVSGALVVMRSSRLSI